MKTAHAGIVALTADELEVVSGGWCGTPYPGWWKVGPLPPEPDPIYQVTLPVLEAPVAKVGVLTPAG